MQFSDGIVGVQLVIKYKDIYTYGVVNLYVRRCTSLHFVLPIE